MVFLQIVGCNGSVAQYVDVVSVSVWRCATQNGVGVLTAQYEDVVAQYGNVVLRNGDAVTHYWECGGSILRSGGLV
jgi:hypothetical protein